MLSPQLTTHNSSLTINRGFSLIEFLTVLIILSFLGLLGLNTSLQAILKQRVISAADTLVAYLETSKNYALTTTKGDSWAVSFDNSPTTQITQYCFTCPVGQQQSKTHNFHSSLSFKNPLPPSQLLIFQELSGRAAGPTLNQLKTSNTTITITSTKWEIDVIIPPHGAIYAGTIKKL